MGAIAARLADPLLAAPNLILTPHRGSATIETRMDMTDLAVDRDGRMLTCSHRALFSVDPETDTPERLREYGKTFNADEKKWLFLTGDFEIIRR